MSKLTGKPLGGVDHLRQSVTDILTTPIGSRVGRRTYGSGLFELIDKPINRANVSALCQAVAEALNKWEPRYALTSCVVNAPDENGLITIDLYGTYLPDGLPLNLDGIVIK